MSPSVDILVSNKNTLPWLKLQTLQIKRLAPQIPYKIWVWDNASTDGAADWLQGSGVEYRLSQTRRTHGHSIMSLISESSAPYIAVMDVDAIPVRPGWLDEVVETVKDLTVGAAGLRTRIQERRFFVHPSFCVFRRELQQRLGLTFDTPGILDVGESFCNTLEDEGYRLYFNGDSLIDVNAINRLSNKVVHFWSSSPVLSEGRLDPPWLFMVEQVVTGHRDALKAFGLWDAFEAFARESLPLNPLCERYLR